MKLSLLPVASLLASLIFAIAASGCAAETVADDDVTTESEDELRGLRASDVVGTLEYGESNSIDHPARTTYRALAFDVRKGDELEIAVRAMQDGKDAVAWLVGDRNVTLARQNAFRGNVSERITYRATKTGRLRIAFREATYQPAVFDVSLTKKDPALVAAGAPSCTGTPNWPTEGTRPAREIVRVDLTTDCQGCDWRETARHTLPDGAIKLDVRNRLALEEDLRERSGMVHTAQGYFQAWCRVKDSASSHVYDIAAGDVRIETIDECTGAGERQRQVSASRWARATIGANCLTLIDMAERPSGPVTHRSVYFAKY